MSDVKCSACNGTGYYTPGESCRICGGYGRVPPTQSRAEEVARKVVDRLSSGHEEVYIDVRFPIARGGRELACHTNESLMALIADVLKGEGL